MDVLKKSLFALPLLATLAHASNTEKDVAITSMVTMINSVSPKMLDDDTQLDGASREGRAVIHHYTLVNHTLDQIHPSWFQGFLAPILVSNICGQEKLKTFMSDYGAVLEYRYTSKDGFKLGNLKINNESC